MLPNWHAMFIYISYLTFTKPFKGFKEVLEVWNGGTMSLSSLSGRFDLWLNYILGWSLPPGF